MAGVKKMINWINIRKNNRGLFAFMPQSSSCFDFIQSNRRFRKNAWMVPHVIKHKEDSELISWRCNWGSACESDCMYAMAKGKANLNQLTLQVYNHLL